MNSEELRVGVAHTRLYCVGATIGRPSNGFQKRADNNLMFYPYSFLCDLADNAEYCKNNNVRNNYR